MNDTTLSLDNLLRFWRTYYKITVTEKIKTIDNKIGQNKAQYNLDRPTVKISALSWKNVTKYEFLTGKDVLAEKNLLEKTCCYNKMIWIFSLGKELKAQTDIAKDQYKLFKDQINVNNKNREKDESDEDIND